MAFRKTYEQALEAARQRPNKPRTPLSRGKRGFTAPVASPSGDTPVSMSGTLKRSHALKARKGLARRPSVKKKAKRTKMPSRKSLVRKADNLVSQIVRLRDGKCVECGSTEKLTNGHVLGRRSFATRFDITAEGDCHAQCWPDNYRAAMSGAVHYHAWYVRTFGAEAFDALYRRWAAGKKWSRLELIALVADLNQTLAIMENSSD